MPEFVKGWEFIVLLLVILVVFGSSRLPNAARSLGRSMRILKAETKGLRDDDAPVETGYSDTRGPATEPRPITHTVQHTTTTTTGAHAAGEPVAQPFEQPVQPLQHSDPSER